MFIDKQSGKDFNREKYQKLLRRLKSTDVVYMLHRLKEKILSKDRRKGFESQKEMV